MALPRSGKSHYFSNRTSYFLFHILVGDVKMFPKHW